MSTTKNYDEQLQELRDQMASQNRLDQVLRQLEKQKRELEKKVLELDVAKDSEQEDVARLEGRSLANFFYRVVGKMEEQLNKEKQEAYRAAIKYEEAVAELDAVKLDIQKFREEERSVRGAREKYEEVLKKKEDFLRETGSPEVARLLEMEKKAAQLATQDKEITEAIEAGMRADGLADRALANLEEAKGWGTWDLIGGGLISDLVKHDHLDEAQKHIENLQIQLNRFRSELADVTMQNYLQVNVHGFLKFADYFWDGIIADWTVLNHINKSIEEVKRIKNDITDALNKLNSLHSAVKKEEKQLKADREELIRSAVVSS